MTDDLADSVSLLYPTENEYLILWWNRVPVAISYAEDVYVMVDDIIVLLETLENPEIQEAHVYWGSSDFRAEWWIDRTGEELSIDSRWDSVVGAYESLLNERRRITVDAKVFVAEWLKLLRRIVDDIARESVRMGDEDMLVRARALLAAERPAAA
ncbi:hypothetical protein [Streptomyces sp. 8L]|uniref:hypothetical protein n=1 Tax=Streptomyces sp. 8L TaxID=2877242 RepID=UPI001CD1ABDB|nr:hypothetical protein [Streptomyces sp. 8L]MCA1223142.1 hypothetical protein [Streptomyces sp. 8L]